MRPNKIFTFRILTFFFGCFLFAGSLSAQTTILDFETPATSNPFVCNGTLGFGGVLVTNNGTNMDGIVPDPNDPTNLVLEFCELDPAGAVWGGICSKDNPIVIDLTTETDLCVEFFEADPAGAILKIKLEGSTTMADWEIDIPTMPGWGTYCVDTNTPWGGSTVAAGNVYATLTLFPTWDVAATGYCHYLDDVYTQLPTCSLIASAGTGTCDAMTSGVDTYTATFTFSQTAPALGYVLTTMSGGTVGGDDPNTMASGTITITGVPEGTNADLNINNGMGCDLNLLVSSPTCVPTYNITFEVDMCEAIANGTFDPTTQAVYTSGGIFYPNCGPAMTDANNDGIYEITIPIDDGTTFGYKYIIGDIAWANTGACTGVGYEGIADPACTNPADFDNRFFTVNGMDETIPVHCFNSCTACTTCNCDLVLLAGTGTCDAMTSGVDTYTATFTYTQTTAPGPSTYSWSTSSGGTINITSANDPNFNTSGTITITGVMEGTNADLSITDGAQCNLNVMVPSPTCVPTYNITFEVDMCEEIQNGTFDPATQAVYTSGGIFYPNCGNPMTDSNADGVYEITLPIADGTTFGYKYIIGDIAWANTGSCGGAGYETITDPACTDPADFNNRFFTVMGADATIPVHCFNSCTACTACGVTPEPVTFNVDMNCMDPIVPFSTVHITGPFCMWCGGGSGYDLTDTDGDGIWTGTFNFLPGNVEFKYMVDNFASQENLVNDMQSGGSCAPITDFNGYANRELIVAAGGPNITNDTYGKCDGCCPASLTESAYEPAATDYETSGTITSISFIDAGASIDYDSATDIELNAGFEVVLGAVFCAFIDGCNSGAGGVNVDSDTSSSSLQEAENDNQVEQKVGKKSDKE